jgi:AbrB family looped-hinge helix DNA binding protein
MEIRRRLRRIGNSMMIAIPSQVVDDLKLKAGDYVLVDVKDSTILVREVGKSNDGELYVGL